MRNILFLICGIVIFINSCSEIKNDSANEILVYNDILDSFYSEYPHRVTFVPPYGLDTSELADEKIDHDSIYNLEKQHFDSLHKIVIVFDSLKSLQINPNYLQDNLDSTLRIKFSELINDSLYLPANDLNINKLKIQNIGLYKVKEISKDSAKFFLTHKEQGNKYYIGLLELSRVKFDKSRNKCILEIGIINDVRSGVGYLCLLEKINSRWIIKNKIVIWIA